MQLQDNDQHDPADITQVECDMVEDSVSSADEVVGLVATMQNVEVHAHVSTSSYEGSNVGSAATETRNDAGVDDDSDDSAETLVIKATNTIGDDDPSKFSQFDIGKSPPDHHYIDTMDQVGYKLLVSPFSHSFYSPNKTYLQAR